MRYNPTPTQTLLLFGVLARHGDCAQAELMPKVAKADREAMAEAKLIAVGKVGHGFRLVLTDEGWAWAAAHLGAELPPAQRALSDLLARLGEHIARNGETLAEVIGIKPNEAPLQPTPDKGVRTAAKTSSAKPKQPTPAALRKRIEAAYLALTGGRKNQSVRLAQLRAKLSDLDRATVDAALGRILKGDKTASLMRHDDPRQLDQADLEAAFNPSGEPFHVIWIAA